MTLVCLPPPPFVWQKEKRDVETATKRLGEAEEERLAAIRRLAQVEVSHSDQVRNWAPTSSPERLLGVVMYAEVF